MGKSKNKNRKILGKSRKFLFFALPEEIKKWIWGVGLFLIAVIVILSFFQKAGLAGEKLMQVLTLLIGRAAFISPLVLVLGGIVFLNPKYRESWKFALTAMVLLILGISGVLGSINPAEKLGGQIGYLINFPFLKLFSETVARIIFGAVVVVSLFFFWYLLGKPLLSSKESSSMKAVQIPQPIRKIFEPKFKVKEVPSSAPVDSSPSITANSQNQFSSGVKEGSFLADLELKKKSIESKSRESSYQTPSTNLLEKERGEALAGDIKINSAIIKRALQNFDIPVEVSEVNTGPTVTQYALKPAEGVKLAKITVLSNDLSLALASHPIRIEAPIPGRPLVGIEVPNKTRAIVKLRDLLENPAFQILSSNLAFCLGRDVAGNPVYADLARMPHLLVAGATGTGKTVCLNSIVLSLLYRQGPENLKFILIDPKRVEFTIYNDLPHLLCPVIHSASQTISALKWLTGEMERRFEVLSRVGARDIGEYNFKVRQGPSSELEKIPYIVLMVDELADLMAAKGREVEAGIVRLAQMARAVGIHLILATQRPSVEVITGLIKANITSRIAFQVASQVDSRTILDRAGAEKLLGLGDMLFISAEIVKPKRIQAAHVLEKEIKKVVHFITTHHKEGPAEKGASSLSNEEGEEGREELSSFLKKGETEGGAKSLTEVLNGSDSFSEEDPLYEEAKRVVVEYRRASASLLQRRLKIGYARAARLIDVLEEKRVVGPGEGAKPREVYIQTDGEDEGWRKV